MDDLISRQAAIVAIEKLILPQVKGETAAEEISRALTITWRCAISCAEEMIERLPSAERLGRWEKIELSAPSGDYVMFQCSECASLYYEPSSYCPNCGARMEVE